METDDSSSLTEHNQEVGEVNTKETLVQNEVDSLLEEEGKTGKRDNSKEEAGDVTKQLKERTPSNTDDPDTQQDDVIVTTGAKKKRR